MSAPAIQHSALTRVIAHLRLPVYRNGYALIFSAGVTSALGMLYWILAARTYSTEVVGVNSAIISSMVLLANIAQLSMSDVLNRTIPTAHKATRRVILTAYTLSSATAVVAALLFILGEKLGSHPLALLASTPALTLGFAFAAATWGIFVLQDSALIGLRQAIWVPVENLIYSVLKIGLLIAFAVIVPQYGVFASWTLAVVVMLPPVNLLIFRRLIPRHIQQTSGQAAPIRIGKIVRLAAGDSIASLFSNVTTSVIPLLILDRAGASANAYYFLSWQVAYSLYLVSRQMGMAFVTEAAGNPSKLGVYSYQVFRQTLRLVAVAVILMMLGAPLVLQLFGKTYADEAITVLRLLCLSALPNIVTTIYVSIARVQGHGRRIIAVNAGLGIPVILLSLWLLPLYGIAGVGLAWLLSQTVVAAILLATALRALWLPQMTAPLYARAVSEKARRAWQQRGATDDARAVIPAVLARIPAQPGSAPPTTWQGQAAVKTLNDVVVVRVGPANQPPAAIIRLPRGDAAITRQRHQQTMLTELRADARAAAWSRQTPTPLAHGEVSGQAYFVESMLQGVGADTLLPDPARRQRIQENAASAILDLHRLTAKPRLFDGVMMDDWIEKPLTILRGIEGGRLSAALVETAAQRLSEELAAALRGRTLAVGWSHRDYVPENILVSADDGRVTGIVDWELASPSGLQALDLPLFLLSSRMHVQRRELADIIREAAREGAWSPDEQRLIDQSGAALPGEAIPVRPLVLLCWLHHVSANLTKSSHYAHHSLWIMRNVGAMLQYVNES